MEKKQYIDIEIVKFLMKQNGIDDKALALASGFSLYFIKKFLSGADQRHYSAIRLIRLAEALNVSADLLVHKDYKK